MHRRERAQVLVFLTAMLPLFLAVIGLALDGGHVFAERAYLQAIADASARAGAIRVDTTRMYQEGTGAVLLDAREASRAALAYAEYHGIRPDAIAVSADEHRVRVELQHGVPTVFVRIVHVDTVVVRASATAGVRYGVDQALSGH